MEKQIEEFLSVFEKLSNQDKKFHFDYSTNPFLNYDPNEAK